MICLTANNAHYEILRRSIVVVGVVCVGLFLHQITSVLVDCLSRSPEPSVCAEPHLTLPHTESEGSDTKNLPPLGFEFSPAATASASSVPPCNPGPEQHLQ